MWSTIQCNAQLNTILITTTTQIEYSIEYGAGQCRIQKEEERQRSITKYIERQPTTTKVKKDGKR